MIDWLIQTTAHHPHLIRGQAPPGLLSPAETAVLDTFSVLKRRQDWLLGRWTAKRLLQALIQQQSRRTVLLENFSILPGKDGAPRVHFDLGEPDIKDSYAISISHSHGISLCAAVSGPDSLIGADIELVEPRHENFASDFFTPGEQAQINHAAPERHDTLITAIWSGKEAALKAIRQGFRTDTRIVSCRFNTPPTQYGAPASLPAANPHGAPASLPAANPHGAPPSLPAANPTNWQPFAIHWEDEKLRTQYPPLTGWWAIHNQFILTLATKEDTSPNMFPTCLAP